MESKLAQGGACRDLWLLLLLSGALQHIEEILISAQICKTLEKQPLRHSLLISAFLLTLACPLPLSELKPQWEVSAAREEAAPQGSLVVACQGLLFSFQLSPG